MWVGAVLPTFATRTQRHRQEPRRQSPHTILTPFPAYLAGCGLIRRLTTREFKGRTQGFGHTPATVRRVSLRDSYPGVMARSPNSLYTAYAREKWRRRIYR